MNPPFVKVVPDLFVRNERLVFEIQLAKGCCYVVMVGALNVGRMESPFWPEMTTNSGKMVFEHRNDILTFDSPRSVKAGDELGTFMLGSTVVVVFDEVAEEQLSPHRMAPEPAVPALAWLGLYPYADDAWVKHIGVDLSSIPVLDTRNPRTGA